MTRPTSIPPLHRTVVVPWDQAAAFRRWTEDFGRWWPLATHSVGGRRTASAVFEGRSGGGIYEVHTDGGRSAWGVVLSWEPPGRLVFTWHPGRQPETAGEVELTFTPEGQGTRIDLIHRKWENWGAGAARARRGYTLGWAYLLDIFAGRTTGLVVVLGAITWIVNLLPRRRGTAVAAILGLSATLLAAACGAREGRRSAEQRRGGARTAAAFVAPADTVTWRGVYRRDGDDAVFRPCTRAVGFRVAAADSVMDRLDASVDWNAPRPTTTIFVELRGDTTPAGRDSSVAGTLAVVELDSTRELLARECAPRRPEAPPPADPARVAAALRAALGADSALARPANYRSAAVWLDQDSRGDLLILIRAPRLCELAGCTLFSFTGTADGYTLIGRTAGVTGPVRVRRWPNAEVPSGVDQEVTEGHVDLQVQVSGGAFGLRDAMLRFRGGRYPRHAAFEPPPGGRRGGARAEATIVIR